MNNYIDVQYGYIDTYTIQKIHHGKIIEKNMNLETTVDINVTFEKPKKNEKMYNVKVYEIYEQGILLDDELQRPLKIFIPGKFNISKSHYINSITIKNFRFNLDKYEIIGSIDF